MRADHDWIHGRGKDENQKTLKNSKVVILGCGALGSHVAVRLAQAGVGRMILVDPEILETANVGRHALGLKDIQDFKSVSLAAELCRRFPHEKFIPHRGTWESFLGKHGDEMRNADLIVSAIGEWSGEGSLNEWQVSEDSAPPILYGWMEPCAAVAHALLVKKTKGCLRCILTEQGEMREPDSIGWPNESGLDSEPACGSIFQPYGPVDVAFAEALVADLSIAALLGDQKDSIHKTHATSEARIQKLGGKWSDTHKKFRPDGFTGSFQYERSLGKDPQCPICSKKS